MRDKLIHEYFGVDLALVWDVVSRDLPDLRPRLERLVQMLETSTDAELAEELPDEPAAQT
jgi:uncharacterized protein with HEPN domain